MDISLLFSRMFIKVLQYYSMVLTFLFSKNIDLFFSQIETFCCMSLGQSAPNIILPCKLPAITMLRLFLTFIIVDMMGGKT